MPPRHSSDFEDASNIHCQSQKEIMKEVAHVYELMNVFNIDLISAYTAYEIHQPKLMTCQS